MRDDHPLTFWAKGVGAFFGFLFVFFSVSAYLGSGVIGIEASVGLAIGFSIGLMLLWPRLRDRPDTPPPASSPSPPPLSTGPTQTGLCNPGPYKVVNGDTVKLELVVKAGDKIEGYVREINNDFFDWVIVDEDDMIQFFAGKRPTRQIGGRRNVTVSKVDCRVPRTGPWYLLLDIGSRQNDREVEVVLRRA